MKSVLVQGALLVLGTLSLISCRDGSFEQQTYFQNEADFDIELIQNRIEEVATRANLENQYCFSTKNVFKVKERLFQTELAEQSFELLAFWNNEALHDQALTSISSANSVIEHSEDVCVPFEDLGLEHEILLRVSSSVYGTRWIQTRIFLAAADAPQILNQQVLAARSSASSTSANTFRLTLQSLTIQLVESTEQRHRFQVQASFIDPVSNQKLRSRELHASVSWQNRMSDQVFSAPTTLDGLLSFDFEVPFDRFHTEYQQSMSLTFGSKDSRYTGELIYICSYFPEQVSIGNEINCIQLSKENKASFQNQKFRVYASDLDPSIELEIFDWTDDTLRLKLQLERPGFNSLLVEELSFENIELQTTFVKRTEIDELFFIESKALDQSLLVLFKLQLELPVENQRSQAANAVLLDIMLSEARDLGSFQYLLDLQRKTVEPVDSRFRFVNFDDTE